MESANVISQTAAPPITSRYLFLPLEQLTPSTTNPRKTFDEAGLRELADSILLQGVIEPLIVRPTWSELGAVQEQCEIVAGERRYRAAKLAGLPAVPVIVRDLTDREAIEMQVTENEQREDVKPLEQAAGYGTLKQQLAKEDPKATNTELVERVAARIGKSVRHVYARLKLVELAPELQEALNAGQMESSHADLLVTLGPNEQKAVYDDYFSKDAREDWGTSEPPSVRTLKAYIERDFRPLKKAPWKLDDARLDPVCTTCQFNSANSGGDAKKPLCSNQECYEAKVAKFIPLQIAELKQKFPGVEPIQISGSYLPQKGVLGSDRWKRAAAKSCDHIVPAVQVDFNGTPEKVFTVCTDKKCKVHFAKPAAVSTALSAKQIEQNRQAELEEKAELAGDHALVLAVLGQVKQVGAVELHLFAEQFAQHADLADDGIDLMARFFGWTRSGPAYQQLGNWVSAYAGKMTPAQLAQFLVASIVMESIEDYGAFGQEEMDKLAQAYKLDPKAIRKTAAGAVLKPVQTSAELKPGKCRVCGCVQAHACVLGRKGKSVLTCKWADSTKTLCSNPECLKQANTSAKSAAKAAAPKTATAKKPATKPAATGKGAANPKGGR